MTAETMPVGETGLKRCNACGEEKPPGRFYRKGTPKGRKQPALGRSTICKNCMDARAKKRRLANPARHTIYARRARLMRTYGINEAGYLSLLRLQGGGCAICGSHPNGSALRVDHDHATRRVRGLLCESCNLKLGGFERLLPLMARVLIYLRDPPAVKVPDLREGYVPRTRRNP